MQKKIWFGGVKISPDSIKGDSIANLVNELLFIRRNAFSKSAKYELRNQRCRSMQALITFGENTLVISQYTRDISAFGDVVLQKTEGGAQVTAVKVGAIFHSKDRLLIHLYPEFPEDVEVLSIRIAAQIKDVSIISDGVNVHVQAEEKAYEQERLSITSCADAHSEQTQTVIARQCGTVKTHYDYHTAVSSRARVAF